MESSPKYDEAAAVGEWGSMAVALMVLTEIRDKEGGKIWG